VRRSRSAGPRSDAALVRPRFAGDGGEAGGQDGCPAGRRATPASTRQGRLGEG
jgi:hypothetical protein